GVTPQSAFGELVAYRLGGPPDMEIETTLRLTEALRAAAMRRAPDALGAVAEGPSGADTDGRASPRTHAAHPALPFVSEGQRHADGRVLGVAVILPRQVAPAVRRGVGRVLASLTHLDVPGVGRLGLERLTADQTAPHNLRPETWAGPSRRWASVTP